MRPASPAIFLAALLAALAFLSGCAVPGHQDRVVVPGATVNGQVARTVLDTGSSVSFMEQTEARHLKVQSTPSSPDLVVQWFDRPMSATMSEPIQFVRGAQTFTTPLPVENFPWADFDVLVGWPDVQDNILDFDSSTHTIRSLETLPPETASWTKLKIHPADTLSLEVPLPGNHTGVVEVDTGSPTGIVLPPSTLEKWKKAHPNAPSDDRGYSFLLFLTVTISGTTQADEYDFGPLKLNNVTLSRAGWKDMADDYLGTLGLNTFERVDMIVDCKSGFAYLHPKPPTSDPVKTQDWMLASNVHLSPDHMLAFAAINRGLLKDDQGDDAGAIAEYTTAIQLDPHNAELYFTRAEDCLGLQKFAEAAADFDHYLQLHPAEAEYPRLFLYLLRLRLGQPPSDLDKSIAEWKDSWVKTVGQFLLGKSDEPALLAAAEKPDKEPVNGQRCEAYFYIGEMRLLHHDDAGAREYFQKSLATGQNDYVEYKFAGAELKQLEGSGK